MTGCFVTGTDTEVGKTWVCRAILQGLAARGVRTAAMKPVASGCDVTGAGLRSADALALMAGATASFPYNQVNPYAFEPAIAPHLAARDSGVEIRFQRIRDCLHGLATAAQFVVVEGVGGWRVPLGPDGDVADLATGLGLPVILVVGIRLGCINHALLSAESILGCGAPLHGWIGSRVDPDMSHAEENLTTLRSVLPVPCLGTLPHRARFDGDEMMRCLDVTSLCRARGSTPIARP